MMLPSVAWKHQLSLTWYNMFVYFSASTHLWQVLMHHVPHLIVKPLSETRWECRINALKPLHYQLGDIYDARTEISKMTRPEQDRLAIPNE